MTTTVLSREAVIEVDASVLLTKQHPAFREYGAVDGYRILVRGEPTVFAPPAPGTSLENFLLGFSGLDAICLCIPEERADDTILLSCDLYGLTEFYYRIRGGTLLLSLSVEPLLSIGSYLDELSMFELYYTGTIFGENTPFEDIKRSYPLAYLRVSYQGDRPEASYVDCFPVDGGSSTQDLAGALGEAVGRIRSKYNNPMLTFSGGIDSTALLACLAEQGGSFALAHYYLDDNTLSEGYWNALRYQRPLNVIVPQCKLKIFRLALQACAIHSSPEMDQELADWAVESDCDCTLTGQNADMMCQFGNTRVLTLHPTLRNLLLHGFSSNAVATLMTRYLQSYYPSIPARMLRLYEEYHLGLADRDFELAFLTVFACYRNSNPFYQDLQQLCFLPSDLYEEWFMRIRNHVVKIRGHNQLNLRQKLYVVHLRNYGVGGDVRCITSAARHNNLANFQVYTTPPMFRYFFNRKPRRMDIWRPKESVRRYGRWKPVERLDADDVLMKSQDVNAYKAKYRSAGPLSTVSLQDKLEQLNGQYPWISRSSLYALSAGRFMVLGWGNYISHLYALLVRDFKPGSFEGDSDFLAGPKPWARVGRR